MAANTISKFGTDYLQLGLRIGRHHSQYVDYYYGPTEIKEKVSEEPIKSPNLLLEECSSLQKQVSNQGFNAKREIYLEKMLDSMEVFVKVEILKQDIPFEEVFRIQCDAELKPIRESKLQNLRDEFDEFYKGKGTLEERMEAHRIKRKVDEDIVYSEFKKGQDIVREKTVEFFPNMLPEGEGIKIEEISDKNRLWLAYESYQGNYKSIVQYRKEGMYWTGLLRVSCHESYPGHHTKFVVAEDKLFKERNHFEQGILLYRSPAMMFCEGMAGLSLNVLFSAREQEEIALNQFCPDRNDDLTVDLLFKQNLARKRLPMIDFNAAYHAHIDGWESKRVRNYVEEFELWDSVSIDKKMEIIYSPVHKMSVFTPQLGKQLIIDKYGEYPDPKDFRKMLENPLLPSDLV